MLKPGRRSLLEFRQRSFDAAALERIDLMREHITRTANFRREERARHTLEQQRLLQEQQEAESLRLQQDEGLLRLTRGNTDPWLLQLAASGVIPDPDEVDAEVEPLFGALTASDGKENEDGRENALVGGSGNEQLESDSVEIALARGPASRPGVVGGPGATGIETQIDGSTLRRGLKKIAETFAELIDAPGKLARQHLLPDNGVTEISDPDNPVGRRYRINPHDNSVTVIDYDSRGETIVRETRHPNTTAVQGKDGSISLEKMESYGNKTGTSVDSLHPPVPPGTQISDAESSEGNRSSTAPQTKNDQPRKGKAASDNSKNERHGDGGRALAKAGKRIEELEQQLETASSKKERNRIGQKIKNILDDAFSKRRGKEHSRGRKR